MTERKLRNWDPSNETTETSLQEQAVARIASSQEQPVPEAPKVELHLRLADDVLVSVQYAPRSIDLSARFDKMKWEFYEPVAEGFHRLISMLVRLDINDVRITQTLRIVPKEEKKEGRNGEAGAASMAGSPRLTIRLPSEFAKIVASGLFKRAIAAFLHQIKTGKFEKLEDLIAVHGGEGELPISEVTADDAVQEVAEQVRVIMGGRTLPCACVIESPLWPDHFELRGVLAPKPEIEAEPSQNVPLLCSVDGYRKRDRFVYLLPNFPVSAAAIEVSFSEREWLEIIKESAACEGQLFDVEFDQVRTGTKIKRTLTKLAKTDGDGLLRR